MGLTTRTYSPVQRQTVVEYGHISLVRNAIEEYLESGWRVVSMVAESSPYSAILVVYERTEWKPTGEMEYAESQERYQ